MPSRKQIEMLLIVVLFRPSPVSAKSEILSQVFLANKCISNFSRVEMVFIVSQDSSYVSDSVMMFIQIVIKTSLQLSRVV